MRNKSKKELLNILLTIEQVQARMFEFYVQKEFGLVNGLLADCQEAAIEVGNFLEQQEAMDGLVEKLEEYCELLYRFSLCSESFEAGKKRYALLVQKLKQIRSMLDKVVATYEVVFLPYKASMWDSLESIWRAANQDPIFNTHVIAIPYYEKSSDECLRKEIVEKELFPDYVHMTDYKDYDLQAEEPDAIFIHNPYDDANIVTQVNEHYFSSVLHNYTDCLVYVPYFVTSNDLGEHFCFLPGVLNSDYTIVQSNIIRQIYVDVIRQKLEQYHVDSKSFGLEQKIVALGSPKIDKVLTTKSDDYILPENWQNILKDKKSILYNTSIDTLLNAGEQALKKIKYVFDMLKKKDGVALWWRPHPLTKATIKTMRPEFYNTYMNLIDEFKENHLGVYDETADLNRAIACTDAYFGDWSSLIWLYMVTGKPVMINKPLLRERLNGSIKITDFVVVNNCIWFLAHNINAILKMDIKTCKIELIGQITGEMIAQQGLSFTTISIGTKLIFIPLNSRYIVEVDTTTNVFHQKYLGENKTGKGLFIGAVQIGVYLYLLPVSGKKLAKYNIESKEIEDWIEIDKGKEINCRRRVVKYNEHFYYFITCDTNRMYRFDSKQEKICYQDIGENEWRFYGIEKYDTYLILILEDKAVLWDILNNQIECTIDFPMEIGGGVLPFVDVVFIGNKLYLFPCSGSIIVQIDIKERQVEYFLNCAEREESEESIDKNYKYFCAHKEGGNVWAFSNYENCLQKIDVKTKEVVNISIKLDENIIDELLNKDFYDYKQESEVGKTMAYCESEQGIITIGKFAEAVGKGKFNKNNIRPDTMFFENADGTCGKKIMKFVKNHINQET